MDIGFVHLGIAKRLLDGLQGAAEEIGAQILEASAGDGSVEIDAFEQRVDLDAAKREWQKYTDGLQLRTDRARVMKAKIYQMLI